MAVPCPPEDQAAKAGVPKSQVVPGGPQRVPVLTDSVSGRVSVSVSVSGHSCVTVRGASVNKRDEVPAPLESLLMRETDGKQQKRQKTQGLETERRGREMPFLTGT